MEIAIIIRDTDDGQVEIEETRWPYPDESLESVTTASVLADELKASIEELGETDAIEQVD